MSRPNNSDHRRLHWRLLRQVGAYWPHFGVLLLLSALAPPLALLTPLPLKIAVDSIIDHRPLPNFIQLILSETMRHSEAALLIVAIALMIGVALLSQLRDFLSNLLSTYTGEKLLRGFRAQLFHHTQRLSLIYHDTRGTADSIYRIQSDAASLQRIAAEGFVPLVTSAFTLAGMIFVTMKIAWPLALVALGVSPLLLLSGSTYRKRLRRQSHQVKRLESSAVSVLQEAFGAARVVKAFGQEHHEESRFAKKSDEAMRARLRLTWTEGSYGMIVALLTATATAAVLFIGVRRIEAGTLTLGNFLLVMGYLTQLAVPLKTLSKKMTTMQGNLAGAERAFALLDEITEVPEPADPRPLGRACGAMVFERVCFAYSSERTVLTDLSFDIDAGTRVGIIGATGAGKTTLVNLLLRFYDPITGRVLLDGVDLRNYKLADLRNQFALVLQEPVLFSTSIAENIAYARSSAPRTEIIAAAKAANAHEFILSLPHAYETLVGERGMCLSGGERQRISLARAFLKDAPILILDEPTSSVDVRTEAAIVEAMRRLMRGRTTFLITHRPSALKYCQIVLRIEGGRLISMEPVASMNSFEPVSPGASGIYAIDA
ncbi:MAG TPA: ABC transporter ATP-binding protein [Verrucomicrobiae bacterium]|nr:ABC transporter ATP-binding protein [Verrucomicrobiae bacterium]